MGSSGAACSSDEQGSVSEASFSWSVVVLVGEASGVAAFLCGRGDVFMFKKKKKSDLGQIRHQGLTIEIAGRLSVLFKSSLISAFGGFSGAIVVELGGRNIGIRVTQ